MAMYDHYLPCIAHKLGTHPDGRQWWQEDCPQCNRFAGPKREAKEWSCPCGAVSEQDNGQVRMPCRCGSPPISWRPIYAEV